MGTAPIPGLLIQMSWPAILSMTIAALYNMVDSIYVSRVSTDALTGVSYAMPIQLFMISVAVGTGVGANSLIARRLGAKRYDDADQAATTSIFIAFASWLIFLIVGLFLAKPFMASYTKDPVIYGYGVDYLSIVTTVSLFALVEITIEKIFQSTGNMVAPMVISMSGCIANIILDPIFIFGMFGMPRLEVKGAAICTVAGQLLSLIIGVILLKRIKLPVSIKLKGFRPRWEIIKDIYAVAFPSIVMQSIGSVMLIVYNWIVSATPVAVAVLGVYFKIESFVFMPIFGLQQGALPLMGFNFGARNKKRMMDTIRMDILISFIIMVIGTIVFQLFPDKLMMLFDADGELMRVGVLALREISLCFIPAAFGVALETVFQATGHGFYSLIASAIRQFVGILPLAYILYNMYGVNVVWYSFSIAEVLGLIYMLVAFIFLYKRELKDMDKNEIYA